MPQHWILKTEPSSYGYANLASEGRTTWDGVKNPVALKHIRRMRPGDRVLVYHTGKERAVVGEAKIVSAPYPDPKRKDEKLVVVDLVAVRALPRAVTLSQIKADPAFADLALVRQGRLSVVPASEAEWRRLVGMARG